MPRTAIPEFSLAKFQRRGVRSRQHFRFLRLGGNRTSPGRFSHQVSRLEILPSKYYTHGAMEKPTITPEAKAYLLYVASLGGKARARKYSKRTLRKWASLGGRPRKSKKSRARRKGRGHEKKDSN
jgi:hypothetical protein